uniref:Uncharacterized protein n=1 Tax=Chromera velia CCMP2878 TaxID=1169474 RepID=A0A0G4HQ45_9ALVE|eukprot:Cvel_30062.t1-p1 / transcript=Cvel_30062.t1 / gene=Cvel_30062 / organism=Chromera_velia_CCMP2878 / gene_product=hypothetical protein / transcript_product=hypothetical protein / location=Cvel_scaffold4229:2172-2510(-) / protein_length=113 / sequence_SO=supercontig / SO=protein_coding / is_pseudo=false
MGKVQRLLLPTLKNEIILSIKDRLKKAATRRVSITLDMWSHSGKSGFLAIKIHWLTENFEMDSASFLNPETTILFGSLLVWSSSRKAREKAMGGLLTVLEGGVLLQGLAGGPI